MLMSGVGTVFRPMALIVLATICLLACVFLLFVLAKGTRDTQGKRTTRPVVDSGVSETREKKRLPEVAFGRTVERRDHFKTGIARSFKTGN
jgi:hypothetical protein